MEYFHVVREFASEFVYAWSQRFEVIAVLYSSDLCELFDAFSFQAD
jgi:hypothetical protein